MRRLIFILVLIVSLLISGLACAAPTQIAVAIELDKLAVQLRGQSDYKVLDDNNAVVYESKGKQNAFINIKDDILYINNEKLPNRVRLVPDKDNFIEINRRIYRGEFNVYKNNDNTIQIINILPIEDYTASVLAKEIESGFNEQVIKALAVSIRSQAYFLAASGSGNYDIVANDTEREGIVYLGKETESKESVKATQDTVGEVLLYNKQPVFAMWHMSSGGYTESGKELFNAQLPYLRSVKDADDSSKFYRWKYDFTPTDLDAAFERAGYSFGKIELIKLSPLSANRTIAHTANDRSPSGRLKEIIVIGEKGHKVVLPAQKFIHILGLNSNLFDVIIGNPLPKDIIATTTDPFGNEYEINRIEVNISERPGYKLPGDDESTHRVSRVQDDKVVFYGYGTGSGLGLSKQGAQTMALNELKALKEKAAQVKQAADKAKLAAEKAKAADKSKQAAVQTEDKVADSKVPVASKAQTAQEKSSKQQDKAKEKQEPQADIKDKVKTNDKNKKTEEITLDKDYYKKILNYYFTGVIIEKVY